MWRSSFTLPCKYNGEIAPSVKCLYLALMRLWGLVIFVLKLRLSLLFVRIFFFSMQCRPSRENSDFLGKTWTMVLTRSPLDPLSPALPAAPFGGKEENKQTWLCCHGEKWRSNIWKVGKMETALTLKLFTHRLLLMLRNELRHAQYSII